MTSRQHSQLSPRPVVAPRSGAGTRDVRSGRSGEGNGPLLASAGLRSTPNTRLVFNALTSGSLDVLGPVIAKGTVGSSGLGYARAAEALGLFLFAFVLARITLRRPLIACQVDFVTMSVPMLALGLWTYTAPLAAAFFIAGCGSAIINLAWGLTVQEKVPEQMLSRIMAIDGFFSFVAMPLGQIIVGPLTHLLSLRSIELGAAGLCLLTFLIGAPRPALRNLHLEGPDRNATPQLAEA